MEKLRYKQTVEKWDVFQIEIKGYEGGNPFTDYWIRGIFENKNEKTEVEGFYDGDGMYKVRFMPSFEGIYYFEILGNALETKLSGTFEVTAPSENNHGPVRVANTYHFAYEDGTPYYPLGTTCYVWNLQSDERIEETLETLRLSAFNKIRFCVFPKHYDYNLGEPRSYPYEGTPMDSSILTKENFSEYTGKTEGNIWDFKKFNVEHFQHIEKCILALRDMGIEADLIIMHPYDRWGFSCMEPEEDDLYWKYVISRFSAYRNIWWSLANEYDLFEHKSVSDWERYAKIICEKDPYKHLRSIHNCIPFYDYNRPWITHCSIQRQDLYKSSEFVNEWRKIYKKPIVLDEIAYEGNIQHGWGNISGKEMVRRFWEAACRGGYPGHGETYLNPSNVLWWSHGGKLYGESHKRFGFLSEIMKQTPGIGLAPYDNGAWDEVCAVPESTALGIIKKEYFLYYYSFMQPSFREFYFDDSTEYEVEVIDTWDMTIKRAGVYHGKFKIVLPGKQFMAIRIRKVGS